MTPHFAYGESMDRAATVYALRRCDVGSVERWAVSGFAGVRPVDIGEIA